MTPAREAAKLARECEQASEETARVLEEAAHDLTVGIKTRMDLLASSFARTVGSDWLVWAQVHQVPTCKAQEATRRGSVTVQVRRRTPKETPLVNLVICSCGPQNVMRSDVLFYKNEPNVLAPFAKVLTETTAEHLIEAFLEATRKAHAEQQAVLAQAQARAQAAREAGRGVLDAGVFAARVREAA